MKISALFLGVLLCAIPQESLSMELQKFDSPASEEIAKKMIHDFLVEVEDPYFKTLLKNNLDHLLNGRRIEEAVKISEAIILTHIGPFGWEKIYHFFEQQSFLENPSKNPNAFLVQLYLKSYKDSSRLEKEKKQSIFTDLQKLIESLSKDFNLNKMLIGEAKLLLSTFYKSGMGCQKSSEESMRLCQEAIDCGNDRAIIFNMKKHNKLPSVNDQGIHFLDSKQKIEKASHMGNSEAKYWLWSVEEKETVLLEQAAELGFVPAIMQQANQAYEEDLENALKLYTKASLLGECTQAFSVSATAQICDIYKKSKQYDKALAIYFQTIFLPHEEMPYLINDTIYEGHKSIYDQEVKKFFQKQYRISSRYLTHITKKKEGGFCLLNHLDKEIFSTSFYDNKNLPSYFSLLPKVVLFKIVEDLDPVSFLQFRFASKGPCTVLQIKFEQLKVILLNLESVKKRIGHAFACLILKRSTWDLKNNWQDEKNVNKTHIYVPKILSLLN